MGPAGVMRGGGGSCAAAGRPDALGGKEAYASAAVERQAARLLQVGPCIEASCASRYSRDRFRWQLRACLWST